ncbi:MAG TPA: hypothetical protein VMV19_14005 [Xanthobacteraceae bacterium]|nr:hypothetical protein [Xanthobacteraceae bacterium]
MRRQRRYQMWMLRLAGFCLSGALTSLVIASPLAAASNVTTKAPCQSFKQLSDGKWQVVKSINIQHGNFNTMLSAGTVVNIGMQASGIDLYAALQKNCSGKSN